MGDIRSRKTATKPSVRVARKQPPRSAAPMELPKIAELEPAANTNSFKSPQKKGSKRKIWLITIGAILLLIAGAAAWGWSWYSDSLKAVSSNEQKIELTIQSGATLETISKELKQKGLIRDSFAFELYVKQRGVKDKLQAGHYILSPSQTPAQIVDWLIGGKVDTFNLTILPGQTLKQIKASLIKYGYSEDEIDGAFQKQYESPLFAGAPESASLEGFIYPDTYQVTSNTTVEEVLQKSFSEFEKQLVKGDFVARLQKRDFTLYQAITLASIVEKEVSNVADQKQVAQVFEKRLSIGMQLGSDVTFFYGADLLGAKPTVDLESPYNTRKYTGLPPGPIANFSIGVLEAVAEPAPGDYVFFVAGDDGTTHFAKTEAEHNANIRNYCTALCHSAE